MVSKVSYHWPLGPIAFQPIDGKSVWQRKPVYLMVTGKQRAKEEGLGPNRLDPNIPFKDLISLT
jgi:hypothetical protein